MSPWDPAPLLVADHQGVEKPPQLVGVVGGVHHHKMAATAEGGKSLRLSKDQSMGLLAITRPTSL